jgi:hypothetical protein
MIDHITQMLAASKAGHFHVALVAALVLPDVCGALESTDGLATGTKYKAWVDQWVSPKYGGSTGTSFSGETCYYYRCAVLHQSRASHPKLEFDRVAFLEPNGSITMHDCIINNVLVIDIPTLCEDMIDAVRDWLKVVESTVDFKVNVKNSIRRYPSEIVGLGSNFHVYA